MKKKSIFLIIFGALVFACGLFIWTVNSPRAYDYGWIHARDTESHLAQAFSTALRINHPDAYDMIDPGLKPRLDEWMNLHQEKMCLKKPEISWTLSITKEEGFTTLLTCAGENNWLNFEVHNIVIEGMKVIDWGDVIEEYD